jgi:hypothetical protein
MIKKLIIIITLTCFVLFEFACTSMKPISKQELIGEPQQYIEKVVMNDGTVYEFPDFLRLTPFQPQFVGGAKLYGTVIKGLLADSTKKELPIDDVKMIYVEKSDPGKTILSTIGVTAGLAVITLAILLATKKSCPFIYSNTGSHFVFDGEPYGGATSEGLERTDYCRLDSLVAVNGEYKLKLTNEVDETQHTDELKLVSIDHSKEIDVVPDMNGNMYTVSQPYALQSAVDKHGNNMLKWMGKKDDLLWESDMRRADTTDPGYLRDTLRLQFLRPNKAKSGKLLVSGSNTLWASQMVKRDLELWGDQVAIWYDQLKSPDMQQMLLGWHRREEVFRLQVRIQEQGAWVVRGEILGGGPLATEDRVVPLDLSCVTGDTVNVMLTPPLGFWQLNAFSMDYTVNQPLQIHEIAASTALDHNGKDIRGILESTDHQYYTMPDVGQVAELSFEAPLLEQNAKRTIYAKVSGYYDVHMSSVGQPNMNKRNRIAYEPGYFTKFSLMEFYKWRNEQMTKTNTGAGLN